MSTTSLTAEQLAAIATRDVSVALSAGAGCGKTHVLTERFLSHLEPTGNGEPHAKLGQLVAITFTDAAAREMRSRIRNRCYTRLLAARGDEQQHWLRLLREIDAARVSTIHAFCTALLRAHAAEAGLDPTFSVLEQGEADVLQAEVMDDVLRTRLAEHDGDTLDLAAAFGLSRLKEQLAVLMHREKGDGSRFRPLTDGGDNQRNAKTTPVPFFKWLAVTPEDIAVKADEMLAAWHARHEREALPNAVREIAGSAPLDEILEMLRAVAPGRDRDKFLAARADLLELLPRLAHGDVTEDDLATIRQQARIQGVCGAKDWPSKEEFDEYKDLCKRVRDAIDKHQVARWDAAVAREAAELGLKLLRLTSVVAEGYRRRKDDLGKLDFDDLLARAHRLLSDPKNVALRKGLSADLRLLLVDEFQDTDPLQVDLVKTLCGDGFRSGRLFFVGDFKQSIYRFRGAMPQVFRALEDELDERGRLPLTRNFRSQPAILHFVNALFCEAFEQYQPLHANRPQTTDARAVEFLWKITPGKNSNSKGAAEEARREEARAVALRLRELLDQGCEEKPIVDQQTGEPRRVQPGDIAILFRALSDVRLYEEALREQGLDYYLVGGHAFYAQQEVYDVLNLLRAAASTADEVSLAGALRSPFFALEDETLFWLVEAGSRERGAGSLNAGLFVERLPAEMSSEERTKVAAAAETIRHLRAIKDVVPIARLLGEALARTGYDAVLLAEFLGERKLANLHKLLEQSRTADHGGVLDLGGFITQLAEFIARPPKEPLASTCPETADVIRLMTIHRAKGLEFPLVVVPDLDRPPNVMAPLAALDPELGPLVHLPADDEREKSATGMSLFAAAHRRDELDERTRLLYVACTRAADYLILSSSLEAYDKPQSDWMKLLDKRFDLETGGLRGRLPEGWESPCVRVAPEPAANRKMAGKSRGPDLVKMLEEARRLAANGEGVVPREAEPIPIDHAARRQFSVSRLSGGLLRSNVRTAPDGLTGTADLQGAVIDARGLGTLVHDVLARIDFRDPSGIAEWCEHLAPLHVVENADNAGGKAREMIERFAATPRGRQLADAAAIHREIEFLLAWPPGETNGDGCHIRGYIDCLYQDGEGRWRLVDYKTNHMTAADVHRVAAQYEMQLYVYAIAAERALGQPPADLVLHFLQPGAEHAFPWTDDARCRAIQMVNAAIADIACLAPSQRRGQSDAPSPMAPG